MRFQKSVIPSVDILTAINLCFILTNVTCMNARNQTKVPHINSKYVKPISESRQFGGETNFQNWKIWDRPEDQLAIESMNLGNSYQPRQTRTKKLLTPRNNTVQPERVYIHDHSSAKLNIGDSNSYGMKRNDCNSSNLQVSFLPVILAIVAVVAGVIAIIILWYIAKSFTTGGSNGVGYGASQGWNSNNSKRSFDEFGFSRNFKDFDFNQLTDMVVKGIEKYKKSFETVSTVHST